MRHSIPNMKIEKYAKSKTKKFKYATPLKLARFIDEYFQSLSGIDEETGQLIIITPPTMSGLAEHLGINRSTLNRYEKREGFQEVVEDAKNLIEVYLEQSLNMGFATQSMIFNLKNNFGWKDKSELDTNISTDIKLEDYFK